MTSVVSAVQKKCTTYIFSAHLFKNIVVRAAIACHMAVRCLQNHDGNAIVMILKFAFLKTMIFRGLLRPRLTIK